MKFPVKPVKLPADLAKVKNGEVPAHLLKPIEPTGKVHHLTARAWAAMRAAALRDGIDLGIVGQYRPLAAQKALFFARYSRKPTGRKPSVTRVYNGEVWHLKKGSSPSASPGKSNHGLGIAVDVCVRVKRLGRWQKLPVTADPDGRGPAKSGLAWLRLNADRFGFSWEVEEGPNAEAWHLRYYAGDDLPKAVHEYELLRYAAAVKAKAGR